jgi:hypothetical protein
MMPSQVVANHVSWSPQEVAHGAKHGAVSHAPNVEEILNQALEGEPVMPCWHTALRAASPIVAISAMGADVVTVIHLWQRCRLLHALTHPVVPVLDFAICCLDIHVVDTANFVKILEMGK